MKYHTLPKTILLSLTLVALHANAQAPAGGTGAPAGAAQEEANPPVIDSFKYEGNTKISTAALLKDSGMKVGVKITKALVGGEIQRVAALYKQAGHEVAISPDIQHPADGHVTVTFKINENGKGGDAGAAP
jgi:outer membrane protein assembly factor BamA